MVEQLSMAKEIFLRRRLKSLEKHGVPKTQIKMYKRLGNYLSFGELISKLSKLSSKLMFIRLHRKYSFLRQIKKSRDSFKEWEMLN